LFSFLKIETSCPDCHSKDIKLRKKRKRGYINHIGKKVWNFSLIFQCKNIECLTKYFTIPPKGVELYARYSKRAKKKAFDLILHLRGSLSRVIGVLADEEIKISITTPLRWIKKAGEECVEMGKIFTKFLGEKICIDEKWIKIKNVWHYVFNAVDALYDDLINIQLYAHKGTEEMKSFLLELKVRGFNPKVIITDLLQGYGRIIKEVFPNCYHHECVLHAERDAKRLIRENLCTEADESIKKKLIRMIWWLFRSKKKKQVKKRFGKIMSNQAQFPEYAQPVFNMLERYFPKLLYATQNPEIPLTTNSVERVIGEFDSKYQLIKGFSSFYSALCFLKVYQVYYRFKKNFFGAFKNKNKLELLGHNLRNLKFTDYLMVNYA
jgi:transposase-like protein